jgi:hypothetical protein
MAVRVRIYQQHVDGVPEYSRKEYDYLCRFDRVRKGMPVVVEVPSGLCLAKVTAVDIVSNTATKQVVGTVDVSDDKST